MTIKTEELEIIDTNGDELYIYITGKNVSSFIQVKMQNKTKNKEEKFTIFNNTREEVTSRIIKLIRKEKLILFNIRSL